MFKFWYRGTGTGFSGTSKAQFPVDLSIVWPKVEIMLTILETRAVQKVSRTKLFEEGIFNQRTSGLATHSVALKEVVGWAKELEDVDVNSFDSRDVSNQMWKHPSTFIPTSGVVLILGILGGIWFWRRRKSVQRNPIMTVPNSVLHIVEEDVSKKNTRGDRDEECGVTGCTTICRSGC